MCNMIFSQYIFSIIDTLASPFNVKMFGERVGQRRCNVVTLSFHGRSFYAFNTTAVFKNSVHLMVDAHARVLHGWVLFFLIFNFFEIVVERIFQIVPLGNFFCRNVPVYKSPLGQSHVLANFVIGCMCSKHKKVIYNLGNVLVIQCGQDDFVFQPPRLLVHRHGFELG